MILIFRYVGLHIEQVAKGINVDQNHYLRSFEVPDFQKLSSAQLENKLCADMQSLFRSVIGKITNISFTRRPDLCFYAESMSSNYRKAIVKRREICHQEIDSREEFRRLKYVFPRFRRHFCVGSGRTCRCRRENYA